MNTKDERGLYGLEIGKRAGKFLKAKYDATGFSRKEDADRGGVTEGYLTSLLAGRIAFPHPEIVDRMARHWGFSKIEFYMHVGLFTENDLREYVARRGMAAATMPPELDVIYSQLASLPHDKRQQFFDAVQSLIQTLKQASGIQ